MKIFYYNIVTKSIYKYELWKRVYDIFFSLLGILIFFIPVLIIGLIIKIKSRESIIYWSKRFGLKNKLFKMAKLRTMKTDTPLIPAKSLIMPEQYFNCFGKILRITGIDELPQLYNILKGDMSFVGPRPVISSETELIEMRTEKGINLIKPGLTGLAQIKGRDKLSIHSKIKYDEIYMNNFGFLMDFKIILLTNYWLFYENIYSKRLILKEKYNLYFVKDILF